MGDKDLNYLISIIEKSKDAKLRWTTVRTLVIDEISMLGSQIFLKLEAIARYMKGNDRVFGGIQVIVSGDFLQLPPVNDQYAFRTEVWNEFAFTYYVLTKPRRFRDMEYASMLSRIRKGRPSSNDIDLLVRKMEEYDPEALNRLEIKPTELFSTKRDVERVNREELMKLPGVSKTYARKIRVSILDRSRVLDSNSYDHVFDKDIPETITLKVGAQVMMTANVDVIHGYANGSRGVVRALNDATVMVLFSNGLKEVEPWTWIHEDKNVAHIEAEIVPLILAWSLTVHKTQGCSLDSAKVDIGSTIFAPSQAYVALSRIRSFEGLHISSFVRTSLRVNREALEFMEEVERIGVVEGDEDMNRCDAWVIMLISTVICNQEIEFGEEYCQEHRDPDEQRSCVFGKLTPERAEEVDGGNVTRRGRTTFLRV